MRHNSSARTVGWAVAILILLTQATGSASAQTTYTWNGGAGTTNWLTAANWTPSGGPPGTPGATGNMDRALFDTLGTTVTATNLDSGFNLGAIATTGASGGLLRADFDGNGQLRLNGGYTVGSFTNVAAAAQNGRDLTIGLSNMSFAFGTSGNPTTFYADTGRTLTVVTQQITNSGGAVNKEGGGTLILGGASGLTREFGGAAININGGTFAAHESFNSVSLINVASGAALQPGLVPGGSLSPSAPIVFAHDSILRILTNGTAISQLQNAPVTKGSSDTFRVVLAGLNPTGTETFTPNGIFVQASSLTGFDPNGTYTLASPGHFDVSGDGFLVTNWSLTVLNNNQLRLDSITVTPVPESGLALAVGAVGLAALCVVRRRTTRTMVLSEAA